MRSTGQTYDVVEYLRNGMPLSSIQFDMLQCMFKYFFQILCVAYVIKMNLIDDQLIIMLIL